MKQVLAALGVGLLTGLWLSRLLPPKEVIKVQEVEKVTTKAQVVGKTTRTRTTKPDGTVIEKTQDTVARTERASVSVLQPSPLPRYSLGLSVSQRLVWPLKKELIYTAEFGVKPWSFPIWMTTSINTKKDIGLGLRIEF